MSQMSKAIAKMKIEKGSPAAILKPFQLSPDQVTKSPNGVAFDVLIKPPSMLDGKVLPIRSPPSSHSKDAEEKARLAEIRKQTFQEELVLKQKQRHEKLSMARRKIYDTMDNQQKQVIERVQKKSTAVEKLVETQKKLLEEKREARAIRAREAKKAHEELLKSKREQAELQLERQKIADAKREAALKAKAEKAAADIAKAEQVRAFQQKKLEELEEKVQQNLVEVGEKRQARLSGIREKCVKHFEEVKRRAANIEKKQDNEEQTTS